MKQSYNLPHFIAILFISLNNVNITTSKASNFYFRTCHPNHFHSYQHRQIINQNDNDRDKDEDDYKNSPVFTRIQSKGRETFSDRKRTSVSQILQKLNRKHSNYSFKDSNENSEASRGVQLNDYDYNTISILCESIVDEARRERREDKIIVEEALEEVEEEEVAVADEDDEENDEEDYDDFQVNVDLNSSPEQENNDETITTDSNDIYPTPPPPPLTQELYVKLVSRQREIWERREKEILVNLGVLSFDHTN